jgi:DNA-binding Lrp family transcriptional regulator
MNINGLEQTLLNDYPRDFGLSSTPFAEMAEKNNTDTATILRKIKQLKSKGIIARVGPVFRPNTIGVSTLAAMQVPLNQLKEIAELVNQYAEVNHNYEREHEFNLWFVATASDQQHLKSILRDMEQQTGIAVMSLPLVKEFHIDLGFKMSLQGKHSSTAVGKHHASSQTVHLSTQPDDLIQQQLIAEIQSGLPIVERPYAEIAKKLAINEQEVIRRIDIMLTSGVIRRMGVIVRHRKLGYRSNAMLVWDIPDNKIDQLGRQLSKVDSITLCYQRPRHAPHWNYNLFTMIHGQDRESVEACIDDIVAKYDLEDIDKATLFSKRCFKQRGACYSYTRPETHYQLVSNG